MKTLIKWIASIFEEKPGRASSKRVGMFYALIILNYMVVKQTTNMEMFWGILGMVLIFAGYNVGEKFIKGDAYKSDVVQPDPNDPKPR